MCPKSHDLKCFDRNCPWKLHTHRCQRLDRGVHSDNRRGNSNVDRGWENRHRRQQQSQGQGYRDQRVPGQNNSRGPTQGAGSGNGLPFNQPTGSENQYFHGMTAQQNLLGALEQQLQQAVTRAIMQALSNSRGATSWGAGVGSVPPFSS